VILRAAGLSDVGLRRQSNEDCYALDRDLGLFLVADGMGGHSAGQVASELAAEAAVRVVRTLEGASAGLAEKLRYAVAGANREIYTAAESRPELAGMGTTLVALLSDGDRVALAHVGDSRAYLLRQDRIRQLTDDHSLVAEMVRRREIPESAAREHPHRHVLTRALGVRRAVEPDLAELTPAPGDTFVLCSDGLTGHVRDEEIAEFVRSDPDPDAVCRKLVAEANARGGEDNVTIVLVHCEKDG